MQSDKAWRALFEVYLYEDLCGSLFSVGIFAERRNALNTRVSKKRKFHPLLLLLLLPVIVLCWPPFYNRPDPSFFGVPFFYWFQILWIVLTAIITAIVYFAGA